MKAIAFDVDGELVLALVPGDREVNEFAVAAACAPSPVRLYTDADFAAHPELPKGYIGPDFAGAARTIADSVDQGTARVGDRRQRDRPPRDQHGRSAATSRPTDWAEIVRGRAGRRLPELRRASAGRPGHRGRSRVPARRQVLQGARRGLHRRRRRRAPDGDGLLRHRCQPHRRPRSSRSTTTSTASCGPLRSRRTTCTSSCCRAAATARPRWSRAAEELYASLRAGGVDVLFDDRDVSPGIEVRRRRPARHAGAAHASARRASAAAWSSARSARAASATSSHSPAPSRPLSGGR